MNDKELVVKKLEGNKKWLYCPKCKKFPSNIIEKNIQYETREWLEKDELYEYDNTIDSETEWCKCGECDTILEERQ